MVLKSCVDLANTQTNLIFFLIPIFQMFFIFFED